MNQKKIIIYCLNLAYQIEISKSSYLIQNSRYLMEKLRFNSILYKKTPLCIEYLKSRIFVKLRIHLLHFSFGYDFWALSGLCLKPGSSCKNA